MTRLHNLKPTPALSSILVALMFSFCCMPAAYSGIRQIQQPANDVSPASTPPIGKERAAKNIPDLEVYDQDGTKLRFYTDLIKGKLVVINFLFTSCEFICPMQGESFSKLQAALGKRLGRDVWLISISTDPESDTPVKLKGWGKLFGAKDGWTFVTGKQKTIERILEMLGVTATKTEHSPIALIGHGDKGSWIRAYGLSEPERFIELLDQQQSNSLSKAGGDGSPHR